MRNHSHTHTQADIQQKISIQFVISLKHIFLIRREAKQKTKTREVITRKINCHRCIRILLDYTIC